MSGALLTLALQFPGSTTATVAAKLISTGAAVVGNGYLRITSNLPLHVAASIGARDGQSLAELPARQ